MTNKYVSLTTILPPVILVLVGVLIYSNTLQAPFYFDDNIRILKNPSVRMDRLTFSEIKKATVHDETGTGRPISKISFALNYYFHKYDRQGYHIVNITIHIVTALLLYSFILTTLNLQHIVSNAHSADRSSLNVEHVHMAFWASLLWAVNPLHTNSITYIIQRMNSSAAMFYLFSFVLYIHGRIAQTNSPHIKSNSFNFKACMLFSGSFISWLFSLGCKQITAVLPFLIILYEFYFFRHFDHKWIKTRLKYFFGIFFFIIVIALIIIGDNPLERFSRIRDFSNNEFTYLQRILTQPRVVIYYISLLFFPHPSRLQLDYDFPISSSLIEPVPTILSVFTIGCLFFFIFFTARKNRLLSFCMVWFFGNLMIETTVIPLAIIYEYRTYLPSMLLGFPVIIASCHFIKRRSVLILLCSSMALICAVWTYQRNTVWNNKVVFWKDNIKKSPFKARPNYQLAHAFSMNDKVEDAIDHYYKTILLDPEHVKAHNNLGIALEKKGSWSEAIAHYKKAMEILPSYIDPYNNLGNLMVKQNRVQEAIDIFHSALTFESDNSKTHYNLAVALEKIYDLDNALKYYAEALKTDSSYAEAHNNLGGIFFQKANIELSIHHFKKAIEVNPSYEEARNNLSNLLTFQKQLNKAVAEIKEKYKTDGANRDLQYDLGKLSI